MKNILIGLIIIAFCFIIVDFIYTEKNTCIIEEPGYTATACKCGFLKEQMDIEVNLFNRYW